MSLNFAGFSEEVISLLEFSAKRFQLLIQTNATWVSARTQAKFMPHTVKTTEFIYIALSQTKSHKALYN